MLANFFPNFLIGLREGLEASLVVTILVAYLVKTERRDALKFVFGGVIAAVALSLTVGAVLTFSVNTLSFQTQEAVGGSLSIIAVAFVTYMIFWMKKAARTMKSVLQDKLGAALVMGTTAVVVTSFLAVGREGLETAIFVWSTVQATGDASTSGPMLGAFSGIAVAMVIALFLYKGSMHLDLAKFFRYTGIGLVFVAAGVLSYGFHDLQEAGILPGITTFAFDLSSHWSISSWYGTLLKATLNFSPQMTVLETIIWVAYFATVMTFFLRPSRAKARPSQSRLTSGSTVGAL